MCEHCQAILAKLGEEAQAIIELIPFPEHKEANTLLFLHCSHINKWLHTAWKAGIITFQEYWNYSQSVSSLR